MESKFAFPALFLASLALILSGCLAPSGPVCGDNICEPPTENSLTCQQDCTQTQPTPQTGPALQTNSGAGTAAETGQPRTREPAAKELSPPAAPNPKEISCVDIYDPTSLKGRIVIGQASSASTGVWAANIAAKIVEKANLSPPAKNPLVYMDTEWPEGTNLIIGEPGATNIIIGNHLNMDNLEDYPPGGMYASRLTAPGQKIMEDDIFGNIVVAGYTDQDTISATKDLIDTIDNKINTEILYKEAKELLYNTDGSIKVNIVISHEASTNVTAWAGNIAAKLVEKSSKQKTRGVMNPLVYLDTDNPNNSLILVGNHKDNKLLSMLANRLTAPGQKIVEKVPETGDIIVAGYTDKDITSAAEEFIKKIDTLNCSASSQPSAVQDNTPIPNNPDCTDTDGGIYSNKKGTIRDPTEIVYEDECINKMYMEPKTKRVKIKQVLKEYYCDATRKGKPSNSTTINCPNGCENGACLIADSKCGNGTCEADETEESCAQDCKQINLCSGYYELTPQGAGPSAASNATGSKVKLASLGTGLVEGVARIAKANVELSRSAQAGASTAALLKQALERKKIMLELAEKKPGLFLQSAIPEKKQSIYPQSVRDMLEKEVTVEGELQVFEKPHIDASGKELQVEGQAFEYYIQSGTQKLVFKTGDGSEPSAGPGAKVRVKGINLGNYLAAPNSGNGNVDELTPAPDFEDIGLQKIAIILSHPPGTQMPQVPKFGELMHNLNEYVKEVSFGQAWIEWDVYGPYEISELTEPNIRPVADAEIDYRKYSRIISIDERNCYSCAQVGKREFESNDGKVKISIMRFVPEVNDWETYAHELGHNFGAMHANFYDCGGKALDTEENCSTLEYWDKFDVMGNDLQQGHYNGPHKETMGWVNGKVLEVSASGTYTLSAYEAPNPALPLIIKIPRKYDDAGKATEYYYIEYRTPRGYDRYITQTLNEPNPIGPQLRITGRIHSRLGDGGDTHQIDLTPDDYAKTASIPLNGVFTDLVGLSIKTVGLTPDTTTVEVTLPSEKCVKRNPTLEVSPDRLTGKQNDMFFFEFELINNDSTTCSDRELYYKSEGSGKFGIQAIMDNYKSLSTDKESPSKLAAGSRIKGVLAVSGDSAGATDGEYNTTFSLYGKSGKLLSKNLTINVVNEEKKPSWPGEDMARKFVYTEETYLDEQGFKVRKIYYILDKLGKVHKYGDYGIVTANDAAAQGQGVGLTVMNLNSILKNIITMDSRGNIRKHGTILFENFDKLAEKVPKLSCDAARDIAIFWENRVVLLDVYGTAIEVNSFWRYPISKFTCVNGAQDSYRKGENHAVAMEISYQPQSDFTNGVFVLSKDGTIYACNDAPAGYLKLNQPFMPSADRQAVAFALQKDKGLIMIDSYGKVYTTGKAENLGEPSLDKPTAKDIQIMPDGLGYGILTADGTIYEYRKPAGQSGVGIK